MQTREPLDYTCFPNILNKVLNKNDINNETQNLQYTNVRTYPSTLTVTRTDSKNS